MHKICFTLLLISLISVNANAQHYYKDIISNTQLLADMNAYKENKIKSINIKSFEDNGIESEGFFCEKKFNKEYKKSELFTRANITAASMFISEFDNDGRLKSTHDSSAISVTAINYSYDNKRRIHSIFSTVKSQDDDFTNQITEEHIYTYNEAGHPASMSKIKNGKDTSIINFSLDEKNNVAIEKDTKTGGKYFYYYDAKNRLTDIILNNEYSQNMKPDYMFEYNGAGLITQMTTVEEGSSNYFVWKYSYQNGLRIKEKCFTNERRLMGSIEYEYK